MMPPLASRLGSLGVLAGLLLTALAPCSAPSPAGAVPPDGYPVRFNLDRPGFVTLVVEDAEGRRVRNLVSG
ncbi:MAG: hypothetical protein R3247_16665, partial [Rhodothermales bacterium]|nr:hypothetical protein [Rhodothermales bacterium]